MAALPGIIKKRFGGAAMKRHEHKPWGTWTSWGGLGSAAEFFQLGWGPLAGGSEAMMSKKNHREDDG